MIDYFKMPNPVKISQRSSTITNSFVNAIGFIRKPSEEEILSALKKLDLKKDKMECIYCGGEYSEWDHLRPLVENGKPTGYITEIQNLVPACGKCNQSKGNKYWKDWINSDAKQSPKSKNISDLTRRIEKLVEYENWKKPTKINYELIVGKELWEQHWNNLSQIRKLMETSQNLAKSMKEIIDKNMIE